MKKKIGFALLLSIAFAFANSQDSGSARKIILGKTYTLKVNTSSEGSKLGYLLAFTDSSVLVTTKRVVFHNRSKEGIRIYSIPYNDIKKIGFREKGKVSKGIWFGALGGAIIGGAIGYGTYEKPTPRPGWNLDFGPGFSALGGATIGIISGMIIGGSVRSKRIKFSIQGSRDNFDRMKYLILNQ